MSQERSIQCVGCAKVAPTTTTIHTLIHRDGWRLTRVAGGRQTEWRCSDCWASHKSVSMAKFGRTPR